MKCLLRLLGLWLLLVAPAAWAQMTGPKIDRVDIKYVGPATVSEQFVRANIRAKAGGNYTPELTDADVKSLYATGQFYNIRVGLESASDGGVILTYIVQPLPRLTDIKIQGNKKVKTSKIRKKITAKVGEPLDEQKLFTDTQAIQKLYEKYGYPGTKVKYVLDIDQAAGRGTATFEITESPKEKIIDVRFPGAKAFSQRVLRKQLKTRRRWLFSWLTGSDLFKADQYEDDKERLTEFYRNHGYLDFQIKDVKFEHPTPGKMVIVFEDYEGRQYKVGSVKFVGNHIFNDRQIQQGLKYVHDFERQKGPLGSHGLPMDTGDVFTPDGLGKDRKAMEDFYGSKGYIALSDNPMEGFSLQIVRIPNVDTGTMDLEFHVNEGRKYYVEKINIHGNTKTKDKVIRRELAISPGEVFDMTRVELSKQRLENLQYFDKVEMQPEPTEPPIAGRENLDVAVEEQNTGNLTLGAGFSSVDALVGFAEVTQGNFDLFHPPTFTGGGEKFRLFVQLGTQRQDYELEFIQPWLFNRKLALDVDLFRHEWDFESPNDIFTEFRTGARVSLTRALLGSDFLRGTVSYTIEDVGIDLNGGWHDWETGPINPNSNPSIPVPISPNVPNAILDQNGDHLFHRFGAVLAYDTRNSVELPNGGQRTELDSELTTGDDTFYKLELKTDWFFRGLFKGHVLEAVGAAGIAGNIGSGSVPFYDRYYLGGAYTLRGFKYRNVAPREPGFVGVDEPIGGDSYLFGSLEYSIPILEKENGVGIRFALFYDVGAVGAGTTSFSGNFDDDWGVGLRLTIPHLGPLRLDYGIPISHDQFNGTAGKFQFRAGYTRGF
ncbi:MAG: outer membrane protein assembly factor BamA [Verrucomicrobiota bacterium]|nr:outer membrane protein assembly factor BamA [Verrucomicrobiota bacterium]